MQEALKKSNANVLELKDNINNGDKLKIPQDNLKKKFDNFSISKKSFNNKKNNKKK